LLAFELDSFVKFPETENWRKELLLGRNVLNHGVPFPMMNNEKNGYFYAKI
jgi:hypothetical protein